MHDPKPYGITRALLDASRSDRATRLPLPLGAAASLADLAADWAFYTPALLHLYGRVPEAAWVEFLARHPGSAYHWHRFDLPLFSNLASASGDAGWNFALFAVRRPYWVPLLKWVANAVGRDPRTGLTLRYFPQELRLVDPVALGRSRIVLHTTPVATVVGFGVASPAVRWGFVDSPDPRTGGPAAVRVQSSGRTAAYAAALAAGKNPNEQKVRDAWKSVLERTRARLFPGQSLERVTF